MPKTAVRKPLARMPRGKVSRQSELRAHQLRLNGATPEEIERIDERMRQTDLSFAAGQANAVRAMGERVRARRLAVGVSLSQLGAACSVTAQAISNIERGASPPGFALLLRIAHALDSTTSDLVKGIKL